ncbi:MAG TPA: hypothetical protein VLT47_07365 [Anaeromyxobacteraceae bacterium]|nr:hypothetical protein [Anaeromyxobacteraceae bacterium]
MLNQLHRFAAPCAALALSACAGGSPALRREVESLRGDVTALQAQNDALSRRLDAATRRLDELAERSARAAPAPITSPARAAPASTVAAAPPEPLVPPNLAVVKVAPRAEPEPEPLVLRAPPTRSPRAAPPLPTAVPISEPDPDRLEALARPAGRELSADADGELTAARRKGGVERAHALEAFVARYPRHPSADNALVEGARDYLDAGRLDAACELARRVPEDYPAGDAVSAANEIVARCERSRP